MATETGAAMKNTRLYSSGKITGDGDYENKFLAAALGLTKAGYTDIENPVYHASAGDGWNTAMRKVLSVMLAYGGVALLPDWEESAGARIEARLAREVGIPVKPVDEWIAEGGENK
jgi:hypothetical protein